MVIIPRTPEETVSAWLAVLACAIRRMGDAERERAQAALEMHATAFLFRGDVTVEGAPLAVDRLLACIAEMLPASEVDRFNAAYDLDGLAEVRAFVNGVLAEGGAP